MLNLIKVIKLPREKIRNENFLVSAKITAKLFNVAENNIIFIKKYISEELNKNSVAQKIRVTVFVGKIKRKIADKLAIDEYKKYRVVQDLKYTNITKRRNWAFFLKLFIVVLFFSYKYNDILLFLFN